MEEKVIVKGELLNIKKIFFVLGIFLLVVVALVVPGMNFLTSILCSIMSLPMIILCVLYYIVSKYSIVVTDKRVYGVVAFGKRVDLPIDSITAVGTTLFRGVCVSTASGVIRFNLLKNDVLVYEKINELLLKRQSKRAVKQEAVQTPEVKSTSIDVTEELRKYKALLDDEIITKAEFEEKKKELLKK